MFIPIIYAIVLIAVAIIVWEAFQRFSGPRPEICLGCMELYDPKLSDADEPYLFHSRACQDSYAPLKVRSTIQAVK